MKTRILLLCMALVLLLLTSAVTASDPVVYGVFFYSPTCPHCHEVLAEHWPGIQDTFGDQLMVLFVDVTTPAGAQLMQDAREAMNIESTGVPMLIIGETVMVGSLEIPARTPGLVEQGLAAGGIDIPPIPSLREAFESVLAQMAAEAEAADTADTSLSAEAPAQTNFIDRFTADPIANSAALVVLAGLIVSFGAVLFLSRSRLARFTQIMQILGGVAGLVFSALLLLGSEGDLLVLALAGAEAAIFAFLLWQVGRLQLDGHRPTWLLPLVAVAGLGVAAYLSYVELTLSDAVCGAVGDCNAVQQSAYAQIFGIPIGVIGMIGYAVILLVWLYGRWSQDTRANDLILALVGSVFSAYLTFLEPFFIGATCMWCLTSAVIMLLILWLAAPEQVEKQPLRPAHA